MSIHVLGVILLHSNRKYRTVCYDDLGAPEEDPRWKIFYDFHAYLEQRFPKV